ncbi:MAG: GIY-YIG nuclease family protein [Marinifilaceae bacterium]
MYNENKNSLVKIGRTKNIAARVSQLQTSLPYDLEVIWYIETDDYFELENKFHEEFKTKRERRGWFNLTKNEALEILHENNGILGK